MMPAEHARPGDRGPEKMAVIIGAGPAGLTAACELLERTGIRPIVFETTEALGGLAQTLEYRGNRMDIGGHRFFSKVDRVTDWWKAILPLQTAPARDDRILGRDPGLPQAEERPSREADPEQTDRVMLVRRRLSRIFFMRRFFDYPVSLSLSTFRNLGPLRILRIGASYVLTRLLPHRQEASLEDFFVNRFGSELYRTFFKDYTEKVWGVPCRDIKPEWGAQRIKGLSVTRAIAHAIKTRFFRDDSVAQKQTETSLIERFMYPKLGPGQMWQEAARIVTERGGEIHLRHRVVGLNCGPSGGAALPDGTGPIEVTVQDLESGRTFTQVADYVFSTMPIKDLVEALGPGVPADVQRVAGGLLYRDFITCGVLLRRLELINQTAIPTINDLVPDNWIYVQEPEVKVGRLQIFNNWSPYLVADPDTVWVGMEYFCNEGDELWSMPAEDFARFAIDELARIDIIDPADVLDSTVHRIPKAYPAYFGSYDEFAVLRSWLDRFENLFLIGRNGMHKYNNQDHSMLTAMVAVDNILAGIRTKDNLWEVNTEAEYHEVKERRIASAALEPDGQPAGSAR